MEPIDIPSPAAPPADLDAGRRLHAAGDLAGAEAVYTARLLVAPNDGQALQLLGILRHQQGRSAEGAELLRRAMRVGPDDALAHLNAVPALIATGATEEAATAARRACQLAPDNVAAWVNLTMALVQTERFDEAGDAAETAVAADPAVASAWHHLGVVRLKQKRPALAEHHVRRALAMQPGDPETQYSLGVVLVELGRLDEAEALFRKVLAVDAGHRGARLNLGVCLRGQLRLREALAVWADGEDFAEAAYNTGCTRMLAGDWAAGFAGYERRFEMPGHLLPVRVRDLPVWDGRAMPDGTLLVQHEQGLGDSIQFHMLLPRLLDRVGRVVFVCQPAIRALLEGSAVTRSAGGRITVLAEGAPLPRVDAIVTSMSIPHRLGLTPGDLVTAGPVLTAEPGRAGLWRGRLDRAFGLRGTGAPMRVGLVWQGNPTSPSERGRSLPLAELEPLLAVSGVRFVALQKGAGLEQIGRTGFAGRMAEPGANFDDGPDAFLDTLAVAEDLDLVVTTCTSVAHVAAAAGRPVWLLLRQVPDWRWGLGGITTPWYPTVRIYRQSMRGDWAAVVGRLAGDLALLAGLRAAAPAAAPTGLAQAVALHQSGRLAEAEAAYRGHLSVAPGDAAAMNFLAMALHAGGDPARRPEALTLALHAVALAPRAADLAANAMVVLRAAGHPSDADWLGRRVLAIDPAHGAAITNLVNLRIAENDAAGAVTVAEAAVARAPARPELQRALGLALKAAKRPREAAEALRRARDLGASDPGLLLDLGGALVEAADHGAAAEAFEDVLLRQPDNVDAWSNLGIVEKRGGNRLVSLWFYREALRRNPRHAEAWCNLGSALVDLGRVEAARAAFRRAIDIQPDHADAHMALGMTFLAEGRLAEGLPEYEWRTRSNRLGLTGVLPDRPRWTGDPLAGRTLLIVAEQGFGDSIQFVRYAALAKAAGAGRVLVGARPKLARLMSMAAGVDAVIPEGGSLPRDVVVAPIMSLPHLFGTTLETVPATVPYVTTDPERVTRWAERLAVSGTGLRVGLVWQGNPDAGVDKGRSVPLAALEPLARVPGVRLIALQKGPGSEQVAALDGRFAVETLGDDFDSGPDAFLDTAAVMMNLDLVVSTDTAVVHLAGALGRPTFAVIKANPEWRWLSGRESNPWYPTLRLFRQLDDEAQGPEPWSGVAERLAAELARLAAGDRRVLRPSTAVATPATAPAPIPPGERLRLALADHGAGRLDAAEAGYAEVLAELPMQPDALHLMGALLLQRQDWRRAYLFLRAAGDAGLATPEYLANLAIALRRLGREDEAESLLRGIADAPGAPVEAFSNLGNLLAERGKVDEAIAVLDRAVAMRPGFAAAHRNRCNALRLANRIEEAVAAGEEAVRLNPSDAETRLDLAHARLSAGDYARGFVDYEARWSGAEIMKRGFDAHLWDGSPLAGRTLLIHGEQGFGDNIQFARFVALAARFGGPILLEVRRPLMRLLGTLQTEAPMRVVEQGGPVPPHDLQIPMISLVRVLKLGLDDVGMDGAYLHPEPERVARWRRHLGDGPLVGLVWQGNPKARADKGRSPPLAALAPLLDVPGVRFVALQKEFGLDQIAGSGFAGRMSTPVAEVEDGPDSFLETAAILASIDQVVASCTSVVHLAGALARPTIVTLKQAADWRWLVDRDDSPWYPTATLVRQTAPGDWDDVGRRVAAILRERLGR